MRSFRAKLTLLFGVGLLVFGMLADHRAKDELRNALAAKLERRGVAIARDVAAFARDAVSTGDEFALVRILERTRANNSDVRYMLVIDPQGRVLASTFGSALPKGLLAANSLSPDEPWRLKRFATEEGVVRDIAARAPEESGTVRIGMSDQSLVAALADYSATLSLSLAVIVATGLLMAFGLAGVLTWPLFELMAAVRSVASGNLRETVASPGRDEIGELAAEFNAMTRALEDKEATRQTLVEKVITIQEEERKRIARDLHDDLSQSLLYVHMRLEELGTRLGKVDATSRWVLGEARDVLGKSLGQMRRIIGDLRPTILDELGLVAALRCHAESHLRPVGCELAMDADGATGRLPPVVEVAVFRIVQEAVNNIARHSGARQATIWLRIDPDRVAGRVTDDGSGMAPGAHAPQGAEGTGFGLQGMIERAGLLGGSLTIEPAADGGTTVSFQVPLAARRNG
ncbi:MAG: HAMP domain-containing protein [Candidatus Sericytochromatia bacterium]|nr:HAMP domain-containing protein [Candidatus Tanganyikabacteria bacterium]